MRERKERRVRRMGNKGWRKVRRTERAKCESLIEGEVRGVGHRAGTERERQYAGDTSRWRHRVARTRRKRGPV